MNLNSIVIAYPEGGKKVKTIYENDEIYFSLPDVVAILAAQNTKLATNLNEAGLGDLIYAQIEILEKDELFEISEEHFINQAGLFRIILRDNSSASKKFQKWVFNEVLPSIQKYGSYPPPVVHHESDVKKMVKLLL
jgi:prophage antirepressor-like protein